MGEILSSFELMDAESLKSIKENAKMKSVLESDHEFYLLIESSGSNGTHDELKMSDFTDKCLEDGLVENAALVCLF